MAKYVCTVCGYVYDEDQGDKDMQIKPGTPFDKLPTNFSCPICGASLDAFEKQGQAPIQKQKTVKREISQRDEYVKLSPLEISALCTNLARGCEKQYKDEEAKLFNEIANYYKKSTEKVDKANYSKLLDLINDDLEQGFVNANITAKQDGDRGAQRALVWAEKVTRILKSLLSRYDRDGDKMLANTGVYVCTICGFVYIGDKLPEVCPVCKVPNWKFELIKGGN